jgi:uncharacterized membrane protein
MSSDTDTPVDLYIATYPDPDAAKGDWEAIKQLAADDVVTVKGLILVSRKDDGKIHVEDNFHTAGKGTALGAVGGAVVGLIFPPTLLAGALVGAAAGLGIGGLASHKEKEEIKADVEETLPPGSSGIVTLLEDKWAADFKKAVTKANKLYEKKVDAESATELETEAQIGEVKN